MNNQYLSIILLLSFLMIGCQTTSSSVQSEQDTINSMEKVENYDGLIALYKSHLEAGNGNDEIIEKLAWAYFDKGDIESSSFYVEHLVAESNPKGTLFQLQGQIYDSNNEAEKAAEAYLQAIELGQSRWDIYVLLGVAYSKQSRFVEAREEFNQARLLGADDVTIKNNIAMLYLAQHDYQSVINTLIPVLKDNPTNTIIRANLAIALIKNNQTDAARKLLAEDYTEREINLISHQLATSGS
ncbi:tetratricopeptide repeat protein [Vibrio sp. FNV 38]|nr:tetratricopeptide repeat protein [Vibrio sp. FNV 38]